MQWVSGGRIRRVGLSLAPRLHVSCRLSGVGGPRTSRRGYFVCFQHTPNETCYKFYVDGVSFLPPDSRATMIFDRRNDYQSPLASHLLQSLPMVEEVTVGQDFVTVKRVEEEDAVVAARYFVNCASDTNAPHQQQQQEQSDVKAAHDSNKVETALARSETESVGETDPVLDDETEIMRNRLMTDDTNSDRDDDSDNGGGGGEISIDTDESMAEVVRAIRETSWDELRLHVSALLTDHLYSGAPHVSPDAPMPYSDTAIHAEDSEVVRMIKELLRDTVRPRLQEDGGDIRFVDYSTDSGVLRVGMLGACRTCKRSKTTLVDLIERTVRHWIPEVTRVAQVTDGQTAFEQFTHTQNGYHGHRARDTVGDGEVEEGLVLAMSEGNEEGRSEGSRVRMRSTSQPDYRVLRQINVIT